MIASPDLCERLGVGRWRAGACVVGLVFMLLLAPLGVGPTPVAAHPFEITEVDVTFTRDGRFLADITFHVDAMLAEVPLGDLTDTEYETLRAMRPEELARRLEMIRRYFVVMTDFAFDGEKVVPDVGFPDMDAPAETRDAQPLPGHLVRLTGSVPEGARVFVFTPSPVFNLVSLRISQEGVDGVQEEILRPVDDSQPYALGLAPMAPPRWSVAYQYVVLGFEHILPRGLDHILFVVGLYLLSTRIAPLLWQVTAFTVAHTLTLALSMYGVVSLPPAIVEPLIAVSIAYVAVENILTSELKPWRTLVVFAFGLLHGLGFAGVLRDLGMPAGRFVTALATFNIGVELGQLAVIGLAFAVVGGWRRRPWYRDRVVVPVSAVIATIGCYWAIERVVTG